VVDGTGRIFVAEFAGNVVREVSPNGDSRVVAGNGEPFLSGDGGPARNAALNYPHGVATDRAGRLWIADTENNRIRRVSPGGVISTVASGLARPLGVAVDDAGKVYIADTNNHTVKVVDASGSVRTVAGTGVAGFGGDGGPAALGLLNYPTAVAVAGPFLYIADSGNHRIRALAEGRIHTVAAGLPGPSAIAVDEGGNLWIADRADHRIRRLTEQGHVETVVTPPLARPLGIAVDARNNVFISSGDGNSIYRIDVSGNVTIVAGVTAGLSTPSGLAIGPTGALFIADSGKHRIRRLLGAAVEPPSLSTVRLIPPITTREPATLSKSLAPYVATPETIATRMLELASVTPADVVYDLGCGDGRIPVLAAKRFGARAVGVEIDEALVRVAREQGQRAGVSDRVNIVHGDLLTTDFAAATVIVLYLLPDALPKLRPVIEQGIRKPVRVISHDARVEGWIPTITESVPGDSGRVHLLYRYDLRPTAER
jgi:DNA-binding beta-propeller fold protein YncE